MIIGARTHEGKTRMLIKIANEKSEKYDVYFYNNEEIKEALYDRGLNFSVNILSEKFETIYDFLETLETIDEDDTSKPKYYIIDNLGLVIKDNVKDAINILSKFHNISLSYNIGTSGLNYRKNY